MYTMLIVLLLANIIVVGGNSIASANVIQTNNIREKRADEVVALMNGNRDEQRRVKKDIGGCGVQLSGSLYVYKSNDTYAMQCDSRVNTSTPCQMSPLDNANGRFFFMAIDEHKKLRLSIGKMGKEQCLIVHNSANSGVAEVLIAECDGRVVGNEYASHFILEDGDDANLCSVRTLIGGQLYYLSEDSNQKIIAAMKNTTYVPIEFDVTAALVQPSTSTTTTTTMRPRRNSTATCGTIALLPSTITAASLLTVIVVHLVIG